MPKILIPNPDGDKTNFTVPTDGDPASAQSIEILAQKILNKIAALSRTLEAVEAAARTKGIL